LGHPIGDAVQDGTDRLPQNVCKQLPTYAALTAQKSKDLKFIYFLVVSTRITELMKLRSQNKNEHV